MSKKNGLRNACLQAVRAGCPQPVYRQTSSRISRIDPATKEEEKKHLQEEARKKLEELFSSANLKVV